MNKNKKEDIKEEAENISSEETAPNEFMRENQKKDDITLGKYLTDFSKNHRLDSTIKHWRAGIEPKTVKKPKSEWAEIISKFLKMEAK